MTHNGVIEKATGDLLRAGYCDFQRDGSFNASLEEYRTDVPFPPKTLGSRETPTMHRWDGAVWVEVPQPSPVEDALTLAKKAKNGKIHVRTEELISGGFAHAGKVFSLSLSAQLYWSQLPDIPNAEFPVRVNTFDDLDAHNVADSREAATMRDVAVRTVKAHIDSGTALKDQVRAATTPAAVDAVTDPR